MELWVKINGNREVLRTSIRKKPQWLFNTFKIYWKKRKKEFEKFCPKKLELFHLIDNKWEKSKNWWTKNSKTKVNSKIGPESLWDPLKNSRDKKDELLSFQLWGLNRLWLVKIIIISWDFWIIRKDSMWPLLEPRLWWLWLEIRIC